MDSAELGAAIFKAASSSAKEVRGIWVGPHLVGRVEEVAHAQTDTLMHLTSITGKLLSSTSAWDERAPEGLRLQLLRDAAASMGYTLTKDDRSSPATGPSMTTVKENERMAVANEVIKIIAPRGACFMSYRPPEA